jgi:RNA polymerase sigma-70 factor (ECF subfamily)
MDRDLVEQASHGDREAFGVLARVHADLLYAIANRILRDLERSEDAVQQALVIAWQELPRLRDPDRFEPWLHRILVRRCYTEARRRRDWNANVRLLPIDGPAGPDETGALANRDQLERGFRRLPPEQRSILVLHHYLGQTSAEIAETLGVPAGTVRSRLHYAHRAMRAALEADERSDSVSGGRSS